MSEYHRPDANMVQTLKDIANKLRFQSINMTSTCNSGHPTSCCSAAEIFSVLFFHTMKYKVKEPKNAANDRFVLSKGHACPILYAAWAEVGLFPESELLNIRKLSSDLEGHPTPRLNFIDVATGSLGMGLSFAAGMAYCGKYIDKADYRVFAVMGDGESAEGSVWEAMAFSSFYKLDNLVAIFDVNRLGQSDPTSLQHDLDTYKKRAEAFGFNTYVVDGHSVEELVKALHGAETTSGRPTCIIAKTFKGKGVSGIEDQINWHGKPLGGETERALAEIKAIIKNNGPYNITPPQPSGTVQAANISNIALPEPPKYSEPTACRAAYGKAIAKIGQANNRVIAMDGDTKNSTYSIKLMDVRPDQYVECFIAEQNLVGVGIGCATRDRTVVFLSTFAAFFTRAFDQIRMGAISQTNVNFVGSHAGVSIGEDGPSQMALEDLAMFQSIPGSTVFYPSDAVSMERAVELAANKSGICFIRSSRPNIPILYGADEVFKIGQAKVLRKTDSDQVTIIGACVTIVEALKAADELAKSGVNVRVIDPFTIKPLDVAGIIQNARETGGRIVTVEDHYVEGGIGSAVASGVSECRDIIVKKLAVNDIPRSGKAAELIEKYGIGANSIVKAVQQILTL
ncbi:hypothetical protein LOTGIDRAFT_236318 [Lottia gigantea]|uniref:Transketolase n=1 Tax=Lottia gigantea TaxID=225164 RepID=V3ZPH2_LOTGI|nr:hypothetical protein LOTGIDRAFT_236318 [Lottia gigantea]ESO84365.1 hypothetical protein LOTGIDRAFT_236318 [Lottia gigantea]